MFFCSSSSSAFNSFAESYPDSTNTLAQGWQIWLAQPLGQRLGARRLAVGPTNISNVGPTYCQWLFPQHLANVQPPLNIYADNVHGW